MKKYYYIKGYWKNETPEDTFEYLVTASGDEPDLERDDEIFYYFSSEEELIEAKEMGTRTTHDFVVKDFREEYN